MIASDGASLVLETLDLLETRLHRLEFHTSGANDFAQHEEALVNRKAPSIPLRLQQLEYALQKLSARSPAISELLTLYQSHPDLFLPPAPTTPASFSPTERLAAVHASAPLYHLTTSRLTSIQDVPIPPASASATLAALAPRIAKVELRMQMQSQEMAALRLKSADVVKRFYQMSVVDAGACWAEWEARCFDMEKLVKREEARRKR